MSVCAADDEVVHQLETETPRQLKNVVYTKRKEEMVTSFSTSKITTGQIIRTFSVWC